MSELLWSRDSANARMRELEKERDELKRENARLKSEVETLNDMLKTHKVIENFKSFEKCAKELQAHKAALEKARVLLPIIECKCDSASFGGYTCPRCEALTTINELLQKGAVKS